MFFLTCSQVIMTHFVVIYAGSLDLPMSLFCHPPGWQRANCGHLIGQLLPGSRESGVGFNTLTFLVSSIAGFPFSHLEPQLPLNKPLSLTSSLPHTPPNISNMPRQRSAPAARAPASRAPARPTAAPAAPTQQRPATTMAAPPQHAPAPVQQAAPVSQGPGLFGQMASTAA